MKVRDVMTREVISVVPSDTLAEVAKRLTEHRISGAPVIENGRLVGILSEGDFLRYIKQEVPYYRYFWSPFLPAGVPPEGPLLEERVREVRSRHVSTVMKRSVVTVGPEEELDVAASLMVKHHVKRLPVVERGHLVGIISRLDLVRAFLPEGVSQGKP